MLWMSWFFEGFFVEAAFLLPLQSSCLLSCVTSAAVRSLSMVWQRGDSSYTSERILKFRSGLKRHFPVRVILKMSLWNFLPPAFSGSFSYSWDKEPEVVISPFQAQCGLFSWNVLSACSKTVVTEWFCMYFYFLQKWFFLNSRAEHVFDFADNYFCILSLVDFILLFEYRISNFNNTFEI